jgi:hypothetical protein
MVLPMLCCLHSPADIYTSKHVHQVRQQPLGYLGPGTEYTHMTQLSGSGCERQDPGHQSPHPPDLSPVRVHSQNPIAVAALGCCRQGTHAAEGVNVSGPCRVQNAVGCMPGRECSAAV